MALGVEHIWCFNSETRKVSRYTGAGYEVVKEPVLTVPGPLIHINIAEVFSALD